MYSSPASEFYISVHTHHLPESPQSILCNASQIFSHSHFLRCASNLIQLSVRDLVISVHPTSFFCKSVIFLKHFFRNPQFLSMAYLSKNVQTSSVGIQIFQSPALPLFSTLTFYNFSPYILSSYQTKLFDIHLNKTCKQLRIKKLGPEARLKFKSSPTIYGL